MSKFDDAAKGLARTRRNVFKIGAKLAAVGGTTAIAYLTKTEPTAAAPVCFLKGTRIATSDGDRAVEDLAAGDLLPTMFGGVRPIQWIGRYAYKKHVPSKSWMKDVLPVRISRAALSDNVPHADLFVTQAHALFIDGVLVPAGSLINGTTITLAGAHEHNDLEYFHIKLETHDVIYAEGAPCETLLQVKETAANFSEYYRVYGLPTSAPIPCAPILSFNGGRSELKSRLRSAISPWVDRRQKIDVIRDHLEERGLSFVHAELV